MIQVVLLLLLAATSVFAGNGARASAKALAGTCYASTGKRGENAGSLLTIDLATGAGTVVGATGKDAVPGLAINSNGSVYGSTVDKQGNPSELILIDAGEGSAVSVGSTGITTIEAIAFDAHDVLFGVSNDGDLFTIDTTTAQATFVGDTEVFGAAGLAFDPTDGGLYLSGGGLAEDEIYSVDPVSATATLIGLTHIDSAATPDIVFDDEGNMFGCKGGGQNVNVLISISKTSAEGSLVGPIGVLAVSGLAFRPAVATSVEPDGALPGEFALYPNYPNPFNPETTIRFSLPVAAEVELSIYNLLGQAIRPLVQDHNSAGTHEVSWDGRDDSGQQVASGVYIYRITAGEFTSVSKLTLLR